MPEADDVDFDAYDKFISAKVMLPSEGVHKLGTVIKRKRDEDGELVGNSDPNPIKDTSIYIVDFDDESPSQEVTANIIAENIFSQIDDDGHERLVISEIIDHRTTKNIVTNSQEGSKTTIGWLLCAECVDGSTLWLPLADLKEANPIETAEYAVSRGIDKEPAFSWWVPHVLKKRSRIIKLVKARIKKRSHKYGIQVPMSVKEALQLDKDSGTTFWIDSIKKEMKNVRVAFKILEEGEKGPVGYQKVPCHLIFDVKMDFTRKARYVAGGHVTKPPSSLTYASVVSRESVRIAFLLAALNDLDILAGDIGNAYLNAPCSEKIFTICGPEFGSEHQGRVAVIVRALYGLKSSGAAWRAHLAETMRDMNFKMCHADNNVWLRKAKKPNGEFYYEYILIYTDDILCVSFFPKLIMSTIGESYLVKPDSIKSPDIYLGNDIGIYPSPDGRRRWYMSADTYVKNAIENLDRWAEGENVSLKRYSKCPLPGKYQPSMDTTPLLDEEGVSWFLSHIGILRWIVELGRVDIAVEVSSLASFMCAPREGHRLAVLHLYGWLRKHPKFKIVMDDGYVVYPDGDYPEYDWLEFYGDIKEPLPPNAPEPLGREVQMNVFIDSDHAGDKLTRRSCTGVLIFLNRAQITWFTKKQNGVESGAFGAEFMAGMHGQELIRAMRYKLRMLGVPLDGPANCRLDNMSMVTNSTVPESTLKKKCHSIAYHYNREAVACGQSRLCWEPTKSNLADMLTKFQGGTLRLYLCRNFMHQ